MNYKNLILKLEDKFNGISKISENMLIFGQLFLLLILAADLIYAVLIFSESGILHGISDSIELLFKNAASGVCLLWSGAILIDYIDKKENKDEKNKK